MPKSRIVCDFVIRLVFHACRLVFLSMAGQRPSACLAVLASGRSPGTSMVPLPPWRGAAPHQVRGHVSHLTGQPANQAPFPSTWCATSACATKCLHDMALHTSVCCYMPQHASTSHCKPLCASACTPRLHMPPYALHVHTAHAPGISTCSLMAHMLQAALRQLHVTHSLHL